MTTNTNSKVYVELAKSTQDKLHIENFNYPLQCLFKIYGYDSLTKMFTFMYHRNINLQDSALDNGIQLHLNELPKRKPLYRLELSAEDDKQIKFKSITSITLKDNGTVNELNPKHLNTFVLETDH